MRLLGTGFNVVVVDPPRAYIGRREGAPPYDLMTREQIDALPIGKLVGRRGVVFQWAGLPKVEEALTSFRAWGFRYVTSVPWIKTAPSKRSLQFGLGTWTRNTSELLMIAKRGRPRRRELHQYGLLNGDDRVFFAPRGRHSEKPPMGIHEWIESILDPPYLEIFARTEHPGWTCIGHDLGSHIAAEGIFHYPRNKKLAGAVTRLLQNGSKVEKLLPRLRSVEPSEGERLLAEAMILENVISCGGLSP